jgi:hypothetical protein
LNNHLRPFFKNAVLIKHNDSTAGGPDISMTLSGRTSWLEVKHANPDIDQTDLQNLTCKRLAIQGDCWYAVYEELERTKRTLIVHPRDMYPSGEYTPMCHTTGFNHKFIVAFLRELHHQPRRMR